MRQPWMTKVRMLVLIAVFLEAVPMSAQTYLEQEITPAEVDRERWAAAKEGINYGSPGQKQQKEATEQSESRRGGGEREAAQPQLNPPEPWVGGEAASLLLRILFWITVAVIIAVLIRYLLGLKRPPSNPEIKKGISSAINLQALEEDLPEAKLEDFLQQAIADKEYTLAIRLYYLVLLQGLTHKKLVNWQKDKTNSQYVQELGGSPLQVEFRNVTLLFERVWYGDQQIEKASFEEMLPQFRAFAQRIQDLNTIHA